MGKNCGEEKFGVGFSTFFWRVGVFLFRLVLAFRFPMHCSNAEVTSIPWVFKGVKSGESTLTYAALHRVQQVKHVST